MSEIDVLGRSEFLVEPLWHVTVRLSDVERELLTSWPVRRLGFVAHAGAASVATVQSYTRLEHSIGLLALVAHFAPDDRDARVAALLHDVGHLPFSHTIEGVAGLDHHVLGARRVRSLSPLLARHDVDPETVIDLIDGRRPSALHGDGDGMRLDHLESFVRSGRAHGRTTHAPHRTLARLRLLDGVVDTDPATAAYLSGLVVAEARAQTSPLNIAATSVMRDLAERLIRADRVSPDRLAEMTDHDLWAVALSAPETAEDARLLRARPDRWTVAEAAVPGRPDAQATIGLDVRRLYLDLPTVAGRPAAPIDPAASGLPSVPARFSVVAPAAVDGPRG